MPKLRTEFKFTLPKGSGIKVDTGRKVSGTMRLIKVKDLIDVERDGQVKEEQAVIMSCCLLVV